MSVISSIRGIRSRASPSILMSRQFTPWRKRVIMVHSWTVLFATELYNGTRKRLLQLANLTLNECIDICRSSEATAAQLQAMGNQEDLKLVAEGKQKAKFGEDGKLPPKGGKALISCKFCGNNHMRSREECPTWGKSCSKCGEKNHFAVKCSKSSRPPKCKKKKKRHPVHAMQ